jgi:hypothetical protein
LPEAHYNLSLLLRGGRCAAGSDPASQRVPEAERQEHAFGVAPWKAAAVVLDVDEDAVAGCVGIRRDSVCGRVNLNAFCSRLPTAASSRSRSPSMASAGSTAEIVNAHSLTCASSDAESRISAMKPATENNRCSTGNPAAMRTSASERSTRPCMPTGTGPICRPSRRLPRRCRP